MCIDSLATATMYTIMDLQSGFWQIGMDEEDQEKTAIITKYGLYKYTVMPFGLRNSPATFQKSMELIFRGLQWQSILIYLDDIIVFSDDNYMEHFRTVDAVLDRLIKAGLKLKPSKCEFLQPEVLFLGHVVGLRWFKNKPQTDRENSPTGKTPRYQTSSAILVTDQLLS